MILTFFSFFFSILLLKIWVFDEVYNYLILYFAVVFPAWSLFKNFLLDNWITFVRNYYPLRSEKKKAQDPDHFKNFFSIFELKIRVFDEVYVYLILQFAAVLPE